MGRVFLGVSVLLDGCPSWPGPVLCPGVCPPSQAICTSTPRSKLWVSPHGRGGRWAGTYTRGIRCSFSFCICAAFQEMPAQVLSKYSRPIRELSGGASFLNSKADNSITTSTRLCTALSSGQPYPCFSENQMLPLSTAPLSYLPFSECPRGCFPLPGKKLQKPRSFG